MRSHVSARFASFALLTALFAITVSGARAEPPAANGTPAAGAHVVALRSRAASSTALTVASATGNGNAVMLLATVDTSSGAVNGGSVVFTAQGKRIGEATVANGSAALTVPALPTGLSSLAANYQGDDSFLPSKSATVRYYQDEQE